MRVTKIRKKHTAAAVIEAVAVIKAGGVVAFPTETAYGLAADPANKKAVAKIYRIKGRSAEKKLPLVAASFEQASAAMVLRGRLLDLARKHWPGPLTIVAPAKTGQIIAKGDTIAVRVPGSALVRRLCREFGGLLTATSANISGRPTLYSGAAVKKEFAKRRSQPDLILDAGRLPPRPPSTIVAIQRGRCRVLRRGAIDLKKKMEKEREAWRGKR